MEGLLVLGGEAATSRLLSYIVMALEPFFFKLSMVMPCGSRAPENSIEQDFPERPCEHSLDSKRVIGASGFVDAIGNWIRSSKGPLSSAWYRWMAPAKASGRRRDLLPMPPIVSWPFHIELHKVSADS